MSFEWNQNNTEHLREMWNKGLTASKIAEAIGNPSRNSVIAKAGRLGLAGRPSPITHCADGQPRKPRTEPRVRAPYQRFTPKPRAAEPTLPLLVIPKPRAIPVYTGTPVTLADIGAGQCRWILHDDRRGADSLCCAGPVSPTACRPFCAEHTARALGKVAAPTGNLAAIDNWSSAARATTP